MKMVNKCVRAYNLKPGDELDWFDSKAKEAVVMVVKSADPESDALHGDYVLEVERDRLTYKLDEIQLIVNSPLTLTCAAARARAQRWLA